MTLGELLDMAEARMREDWRHTSSVMALIANSNRDPKKSRPLKPRDFDPFAKSHQAVKVGVEILKEVFIDGRMPKQGS